MTLEEMELDRAQRLVNPPGVIGPNTVVLCPPLDPEGAAKYITEHADDYARFFGYKDAADQARNHDEEGWN